MEAFTLLSLIAFCASNSPAAIYESSLSSAFFDDINSFLSSKNEDTFLTREIEFITEVSSSLKQKKLYYADFIGDCGYVLFDDAYVVYSYQTDVDYPDVRLRSEALYFDGVDLLFDSNSLQNSRSGVCDFIIGDFPSFTGKIEYNNILDYIEYEYGYDDVSLLESGKLPSMPTSMCSSGYHQWTESVYLNSNNYSEGNCGIVSVSNALAYYSEYGGFSDFPGRNDTTVVYPEADASFYSQVVANGYHSKSTPTVTIHTIPEMVREKAIEVGYVTGGLGDTETEYAFVETVYEYDYSAILTTYSSPTWSFIKEDISDGIALQLCVLGDFSYGNHGMFITGYRLYAHLENFGIASFVYRIPCVSVYDGGSSNERWYDMTSLSNTGYSRATTQKINELWVG